MLFLVRTVYCTKVYICLNFGREYVQFSFFRNKHAKAYANMKILIVIVHFFNAEGQSISCYTTLLQEPVYLH